MSTRPPPHLTAHSTHCAFSPPFLKLAAPGKQLPTTVDSLSSQNRPENRSQSSNPKWFHFNKLVDNIIGNATNVNSQNQNARQIGQVKFY
ncbi:unnamed protein product [Lactuca virosa]|uniref:Uncharacterized protein n=1 Tax=Lactuca virosa TaxID=75947 RepID=A0AAU9MMT8_9ASTR|nr:unnamed protein product [Lactuca virosa]